MSKRDQTRENFLETVCSEIKCKKARKPLSDELLAHINDQKNAYLDNGEDEQTAEKKAVSEMGDPVEVGQQFNKIHRPKFDFGMIALVVLLIGIGVCMCPWIWEYYPQFSNQILINCMIEFMLPSAVLLLITYFFDYRILFKKAIWLLLSSIIINIAVMIIVLTTKQMNLVIYTFYSNIPVLFIPIFAMFIYYVRNLSYLGIWLCGAGYFAFAIPMVILGSYSRFFLVTITCLIVLTVAVSRNIFDVNHKKAYCVIYIPTVLVSSIMLPIAMGRGFFYDIINFSNPDAEMDGRVYLMKVIRNIILQSKSFGTADTAVSEEFAEVGGFNLTYIFDKLGYIAGIAVITLFIVLIVKMFRTSFIQRTEKGFLLSLSVTLLISYRIIMAILGNLGIYIDDIWIPFLSISRYDFIINVALVGFIMSAYRNNNIIWEKKSDEKPFVLLRKGMASSNRKLVKYFEELNIEE